MDKNAFYATIRIRNRHPGFQDSAKRKRKTVDFTGSIPGSCPLLNHAKDPNDRKEIPVMKKALSLLLALCFLFGCCAAGAEETAALRYEKDGFTVIIPDGWIYGTEDSGSTFYYTRPDGSENLATLMIMATREESLAGTEMSEEELKELFTSEFLQAAAASSTDHNVNYFYSEMAGVPSIVYGCRQEIDGAVTSVAYENAIVDGWIFGMAIAHADSEPDGLAGYLDTIGATVSYAAPRPLTLGDLPTKEDPFRFEPSITNNQNYLTAQWMIDASTRALCTMLLTLDLDIKAGTGSGSRLMNVFASYIGCEEDIVKAIIPSQDETIAYIFEYDTFEKTALYYAEPWSDETLAAFEASCPDQYFANTEEALIYVAQLMYGSAGGGEE